MLEHGDKYVAEHLLGSRKTRRISGTMVDGFWVSVYLKRLKNEELLFLVGTVKNPSFLAQIYQRRWQIECFFEHLKSRGFDLESTHMTSLKKLKMLLGILGLASMMCQTTGVYHHQKVQKIKRKKHGYKVKSFPRQGLDKWRWILKQSPAYLEQFIAKFIRYLLRQKHKFKHSSVFLTAHFQVVRKIVG